MIGQTLGHYHVEAQLGAGGMGVVYRALDTRLERTVAIKLLSALTADITAHRQVLHEARSASALSHPNICTIHEVGETAGQPYIVMEYVEGRPLSQSIPPGGFSADTAVRFAIQLADALAHAHERGIIHCDLKSANIIVTPDGRLKVLDFGLARKLNEAELIAVTRSQGSIHDAERCAGTLPYMAPEVLRGERADTRSDIWALGIVLHELASGTLPFVGRTGFELTAAIFHDPPRPLPARHPSALRAIEQRCLAKESGGRYQRASEVRSALEAVQSGCVPARMTEFQTIAVLPFADLSPQKDQEYFCDGIAEELLNALAKVDGLRVASRTSAFQFKGQATDIASIAARLNVRLLLEGSVRKAGERLRITAELVNVEDGYQVWSERYDREMKDVFAVQDEISRAVVDALRVRLLGEPTGPMVKRSTDNLEAYDLYLRGRFFFNKWNEEGLKRGAECFQRAVEREPHYARAYAGLSQCLGILAAWGMAPPVEVLQDAKAAACKAVELDDTLAEPHASLGIIKTFCEWDWTAAESELTRALRLDPLNAEAHNWYACYLGVVGRLDQMLAEVKRAHDLDPLSLMINGNWGCSLYFARDYDRAIEQFRKTLDLYPAHTRMYYYLGRAYVGKTMFVEAVEAAQRASQLSGGDTRSLGVLGHAYGLMGDRRQAEDLLGRLMDFQSPTHLSSFSIALIHVGLKQYDRAFDWLNRAYDERSSPMRLLKIDPLFDNVRSDARFRAILRRMGLDAQG